MAIVELKRKTTFSCACHLPNAAASTAGGSAGGGWDIRALSTQGWKFDWVGPSSKTLAPFLFWRFATWYTLNSFSFGDFHPTHSRGHAARLQMAKARAVHQRCRQRAKG